MRCNDAETLTGLHLSGQDVHGHLVSLGGVDHQPILQTGKKEGESVRGREEERSIDFYLFLAPVLVDMDTVMTAKRN